MADATGAANGGPIQPLILSGGSGTRMWPLSRELYPKQFLPLVGERSLLQETALRVADPARFLPPIVICNSEHRFMVAEQLRKIGIENPTIVLEPIGRNTAPAIAIGAMIAAAQDPSRQILSLASDHLIRNPDAMRAAIDVAQPAAAAGELVTFGIVANTPETGFGYIQRGAALSGVGGVYRVGRFVEKPDLERAKGFLAAGDHYWNASIFLMRADRYVEELTRREPAIVRACADAMAKARRDLDFLRLDADAFGACESKAIDVAVMEKTDRAAVVPVDMGWSDVGSWDALWQETAKDERGNATVGDALMVDSDGCYVRAEDGMLVATVGVKDLVVVATGDAIMIADRSRSQDVKKVVEQLKAANRSEATAHSKIFRPWGSYETIDLGERHQVKHISVLPGRALSLQKHHKRAEHWIVVRGTARVTRGNDVFELFENQSTYIPLGVKHRLENTGEETLHLIEVQSGSYLGEDDIVRFEDVYGRV